jgi:hypothetical protein
MGRFCSASLCACVCFVLAYMLVCACVRACVCWYALVCACAFAITSPQPQSHPLCSLWYFVLVVCRGITAGADGEGGCRAATPYP